MMGGDLDQTQKYKSSGMNIRNETYHVSKCASMGLTDISGVRECLGEDLSNIYLIYGN